MRDPAHAGGPYPFRREDLAESRLLVGVAHTLVDFRRWCATHQALIDQYTDRCTDQLLTGRRFAVRRRTVERVRQVRELFHFSVFNLAEVPSSVQLEAVVSGSGGRLPTVREVLAGIDDRHGVAGVVAALEHHLPPLRGASELRWLTERLEHLHRILPEAVVRDGGMGKVLRAMTGVLLIAAHGIGRITPHAARAHLASVVRGAYGFGAAYAIVDDTLHDLPGDHFSVDHRKRMHDLTVEGLATGQPAAVEDLPEHPLTEELHSVHHWLLSDYSFGTHRHLYHAAQAMYLAQHRDAQRAADTLAAQQPNAMYPDMFIKAGMSRVVANLLARRELDNDFYRRCINTIFISQLRDDLIDAADDERDGRRTPFTAPPTPDGPNPLNDLFAYQSYVAAEVFAGDPAVADALAYYSSTRLGWHLAADPGRVDVLRRRFEPTGPVEQFLAATTGRPGRPGRPGRAGRVGRRLDVAEQRLRQRAGQVLRHRDPTAVDCRTFIADRLPYLNSLLDRHRPTHGGSTLDAVVEYALAGSGKRLRPALGLMLAEGLGIRPAAIEPVLVAGELFHTASLIFDDLPAQDGATLRRGRPAAHIVYGEATAQLAALSMISAGFGLVAQLDRRFPAQRVTAVVEYVGSVLGPHGLCRGQHLDLQLGQHDTPATPAEIIEMYSLKTSTAIEAALVPLLMLLDRPPEQIERIKRYAYHAGIVFQLHDDVLDATSSTRQLGKNAGHDTAKANIVRTCGLAEARRLTAVHLAAAVSHCEPLPFNTDLLTCAVRHFATRQH